MPMWIVSQRESWTGDTGGEERGGDVSFFLVGVRRRRGGEGRGEFTV